MKLYFDFDKEMLSLEILLILSCLMESFLYHLSGSPLILNKKLQTSHCN